MHASAMRSPPQEFNRGSSLPDSRLVDASLMKGRDLPLCAPTDSARIAVAGFFFSDTAREKVPSAENASQRKGTNIDMSMLRHDLPRLVGIMAGFVARSVGSGRAAAQL